MTAIFIIEIMDIISREFIVECVKDFLIYKLLLSYIIHYVNIYYPIFMNFLPPPPPHSIHISMLKTTTATKFHYQCHKLSQREKRKSSRRKKKQAEPVSTLEER